MTAQEYVEEPTECGHSRGELRADQECEIDRRERENVERPTHDHLLIWRGFHFEIPSFDLECWHEDDDARFFMDNEGNVNDECLVQQWFDNDGIFIVTNSDTPTDNSLPCWTTYDYDGQPTLVGLAQYKDWKESFDD